MQDLGAGGLDREVSHSARVDARWTLHVPAEGRPDLEHQTSPIDDTLRVGLERAETRA